MGGAERGAFNEVPAPAATTRSKSSAATSAGVESAVSWPPEASAVSSSTVSPDWISRTGAIELSHTNEAESERILCSEWSCSWLAAMRRAPPLASVVWMLSSQASSGS